MEVVQIVREALDYLLMYLLKKKMENIIIFIETTEECVVTGLIVTRFLQSFCLWSNWTVFGSA